MEGLLINLLISLLLLAIIAGAIWKIVDQKKKGMRCSGCSASPKDSKKKCDCHTNE